MGVKTQTRYSTTYTTTMTDSQTTMDVAAAPANTSGYLTIRLGFSDQEDVKYAGVSGLQLTGMLRGLSPTALTDTEVAGLKKTHALNTPTSDNTVKMTSVHYVINNKPNKDDDETISGDWLFSLGIKTATARYRPTSITDENDLKIIEFDFLGSATSWLKLSNAIASVYTPAFLTGGTGAQSTAGTWAAESDCDLAITIDGVLYNISGVDFTGDATMADVAATLQVAIRAATGNLETVVWSTDHFIISSVDTTSSSAITVTSTYGAGGGTDISGAGGANWMDADTGNGVVTDKVLTSSGVTLAPAGSDTDINLTINAKGAGVPILQVGAKLSASTSPTSDEDIPSKGYVDLVASAPVKTADELPAGEVVDGTTTPQAVCVSDGSNGKTAGGFYKADADDLTSMFVKQIGFVIVNADTPGDDFQVITGGIVDGFTGLTEGSTYGLSATPGAIALTEETNPAKIVGIAVSATKLLLTPGIFSVQSRTSTALTLGGGATQDVQITLGFRPVALVAQAYQSGGADTSMSWGEWSNGTQNGMGFYELNPTGLVTPYGVVGGIIRLEDDQSGNDYVIVTVHAFDNNTITLRFTAGAGGYTATAILNLLIYG